MGTQKPGAPTDVVRNLLPSVPPRVVHPPETEARIAAAVAAGVAAAPPLSAAQQGVIRRVFAGSITRQPLRRSA